MRYRTTDQYFEAPSELSKQPEVEIVPLTAIAEPCGMWRRSAHRAHTAVSNSSKSFYHFSTHPFITDMASVPSLYPGAALIATGLSLHGYRKGSLSGSGAIAAWVVGYGHLANPLKVFGVTMIVFYLVGSRATKVRPSFSHVLVIIRERRPKLIRYR